MALLEKFLYLKKSTIPGAGKGLFTKVDIKKGTRVVEYKGQIVTWKQVEQMSDDRNGYVFYFNRSYCLDAWPRINSFARYANDAKGITRVDGIKNNLEFVEVNKPTKRCFLDATRDIPKGSELFVGYGGEYWRVIRYNIRLAQKNKEKEGKKNSKIELPHHTENKARRKKAKR